MIFEENIGPCLEVTAGGTDTVRLGGGEGGEINIVPWESARAPSVSLCVNVSVMPPFPLGQWSEGPHHLSSQAQHYNVLLLPGDVNELEPSLSQSEPWSWQAGPMRGQNWVSWSQSARPASLPQLQLPVWAV